MPPSVPGDRRIGAAIPPRLCPACRLEPLVRRGLFLSSNLSGANNGSRYLWFFLNKVDRITFFWNGTDKDANIAKLVWASNIRRRDQSRSAVSPTHASGDVNTEIITAPVR